MNLARDLLFKVVVGIFGLPKAVSQDLAERVDDGAVGLDRLSPFRLSWYSGTSVRPACRGAVFEKSLKGGPDSPLVLDAESFELRQRLVVRRDGLVRGFEVERSHNANNIPGGV